MACCYKIPRDLTISSMYCLIGGYVDVNVNLCLLVVNHVCQSVCCLSSKCRCLTVVDVTNDDIFSNSMLASYSLRARCKYCVSTVCLSRIKHVENYQHGLWNLPVLLVTHSFSDSRNLRLTRITGYINCTHIHNSYRMKLPPCLFLIFGHILPSADFAMCNLMFQGYKIFRWLNQRIETPPWGLTSWTFGVKVRLGIDIGRYQSFYIIN